MRSTLFLTGSESFIGRALISRCHALGIEVTGVDRAVPENGNVKQIDIRDHAVADAIPEGATVVHLAAISRDSDCRADPRAAFDINVHGTLNISAAAQKRRAKQIVFASSEWVYGDVRNDAVQHEESPVNVTAVKSEYALTKIVGEQCLRLGCTLPAVTVLRFGIVYGPRPSNWSAVESLFNAARTQDEITIGAARTARRFIHVEDIVSGILASRASAGFETYNLTGDALISLGDVVKASAQLWNRPVKIVETNPGQPSIRNPDNTRARTRLQWTPQFDLAAGLADLKRFFEASE